MKEFKIPHPSEMTNLKKSLGKKKFNNVVKSFEDNIVMESTTKSGRGRKPVVTHNPIQGLMNTFKTLEDIPPHAMDALSGIANLDWYSKGESSGGIDRLSVSDIIIVLKSLEEISIASVENVLGLGRVQASRYAKAATMVIPYIEKALQENYELIAEHKRSQYRENLAANNITWDIHDEELYLQTYFDNIAIDSLGNFLDDVIYATVTGVYVPHQGVVLSEFYTGCDEILDDVLVGDVY